MTNTYTYSVADVETAFRRFSADIFMIADSTCAISREEAANYAHDAEYLAKQGFLIHVDVTLFSAGVEQKAARYIINESAGSLTSSRPGGVMWPQMPSPVLRVIFKPTPAFDAAKRAAHQPKLKISWEPTSADTSHSKLSQSGGRNYVSNAYGIQRQDFN